MRLSGGSAAGKITSALFTSTYGEGAAGDLSVVTGKLMASNGARLFAATFSQGNGGNIKVRSSSFHLSDGAFVSASSSNGGNAGDIKILANTFELDNGGQVLTTAFSSGKAGDINLNISNTIIIAGSDRTYTTRLAQFGPNVVLNQGPNSGLFANAAPGSSGRSGNINIDPRQIVLNDGARIAVSSLGTKQAGDINIQAGTATLDRGASISATTASTQGGNIITKAQDLLVLRHGSSISATAGTAKAGGNGGNITIKTPFIVAVPSENSDISANAYTGKGGNINITAQGIFGIQPRNQDTPLSDITASSQFGINGTVQINILNPTTVQEVQILPTSTVDPTKLIAPACRANVGPHANSFIITGSGGLPPNPSDTKGGDSVIEELATGIPDHSGNKHASAITSSSKSDEPDEIVEATGVATNAKGEVVAFVANAPSYTPDIPWLKPASCQTH